MIKWLLYIVIVIYCLLDAAQTKALFDLGYTEANPILVHLMAMTGSWTIIIYFKLIFLILLGVCLAFWRRT